MMVKGKMMIEDEVIEEALVGAPAETAPAIVEPTAVVEATVQSYPVVIEFVPSDLGMKSFASKARKSMCWKEILAENVALFDMYLDDLKAQYPETKTISFTEQAFFSVGDTLIRTVLNDNNIGMVPNRPTETEGLGHVVLSNVAKDVQ